jgi:hypothetical protein
MLGNNVCDPQVSAIHEIPAWIPVDERHLSPDAA